MTLPFALPVAESYNLDSNGNRKSSGGAAQSAPGTHNRLQTDGTYNYTYDNEGNTTRRTLIASGAVTDYTWDHRNRMTSVTEKVSATGATTKKTEFYYDVFDQRVARRLDADGNGTWDQYESYVWADGQEVLRYVDSDGAASTQPFRLANRYLWGDAVDQLLSDEQYTGNSGPAITASTGSVTAGNTLWALSDHLGSVRDISDNNGVVRQHLVFDSFGRRVREVDYSTSGAVIASNDPAAVDELFGYTARDFDTAVGLQYNRARWYDPNTGRWLSQDPIGFNAGDANLYRYVGNGPTNKTDPSGLEEIDGILLPVEELLKLGVKQETIDYYRRHGYSFMTPDQFSARLGMSGPITISPFTGMLGDQTYEVATITDGTTTWYAIPIDPMTFTKGKPYFFGMLCDDVEAGRITVGYRVFDSKQQLEDDLMSGIMLGMTGGVIIVAGSVGPMPSAGFPTKFPKLGLPSVVAPVRPGVGTMADLPPNIADMVKAGRPIAGKWPAIMKGGKVYVDHFHSFANKRANGGKIGPEDFYGGVTLDECGKVIDVSW